MSPLFAALIGPITELVSEFITDKDKANELAHKIATKAEDHAHAAQMAQISVNKVEAAHKSLFVAGARPAALWICNISLANNYVVAPYITAFTEATVPTLDLAVMMPVMMGVLGLGAYRSFEKAKGVARDK